MSGLRLIQVPYDSGHRERRMGRGPFHLARNGALEAIRESIDDIEDVIVEHESAFPMETESTFGLAAAIAEHTRTARSRSRFPLVLAGNCSSTVGAAAGFDGELPALLWFDGHPDFNTPETTPSGFIDGMGMAMLTGACWRAVTDAIPGFSPLPEKRVALVAARDIEGGERERLQHSEVRLVTCESLQDAGPASALAPVLDDWTGPVDSVYLHIDMDVHDPALAPVNPYQPPGGPSPDTVRDCVHHVAERFRIAGASITAFDPDCDRDDKGLRTALDLIRTIAAIAARQTA